MEIDVAEEEFEDEDDGAWLEVDDEGATEEASEADDSWGCSFDEYGVEEAGSEALDSTWLVYDSTWLEAGDEAGLLWLEDSLEACDWMGEDSGAGEDKERDKEHDEVVTIRQGSNKTSGRFIWFIIRGE